VKARRNTKLLIEAPAVATGDIAFNLIVFFLVCASVQPDSGRKQQIPKSESKQEKEQQSENIEVILSRNYNVVQVNGSPVGTNEFLARLSSLLSGKSRQEDKIVIVKSSQDTPYHHWIQVTGLIEQAGGIVTLQVEEERTVVTQ
jgi:biopolymer transport protein ExbD